MRCDSETQVPAGFQVVKSDQFKLPKYLTLGYRFDALPARRGSSIQVLVLSTPLVPDRRNSTRHLARGHCSHFRSSAVHDPPRKASTRTSEIIAAAQLQDAWRLDVPRPLSLSV
jgi:hypothetical protein